MTAVAEGEDHPPASQLMTGLLCKQGAGTCDVVVQKHPIGTSTSPKEHVRCEEVSWPSGTTSKNLVKKRMCVSLIPSCELPSILKHGFLVSVSFY